jgi:hypothetical protein
MSSPTPQEIAQNIVNAFTDASSGNELRNLTVAILDPNNIPVTLKTALADTLSRERPIQDAINTEIAAAIRGPIAAAIAAGGPAPMAPGPVAAAGQINGRVPCGTPATLGDGNTRVVRAGYCFPDEHNGCNGSILADPRNPMKEISTKDIFMRDSLFVNFGAGGNNTLSRDLANMIDVNNADFVAEDAADQNHFNYRYFFMVDPSSENITRNKNTQTNLVKLRYAVGKSYTRLSSNLKDIANAEGDMERAEIQAAMKNTIGFTNIASNWTICPEFFTYRMLPLKRGFMSANEYNRVNSRSIGPNKLRKCLGIHPPSGMEDSVNDVYVYTFVDQTGNYVTKDTPINKRMRRGDNSFGPGDLPYEDGFFMFPKGFEDTVVSARFPDGILLFSYRGNLSPIPPFGTVVSKSKLHEGNVERSGYPDQATHVAITAALSLEMGNVQTNMAALNAMTVRMNGQDIPLNSPGVAVVKDIIIGGIGYIAMMSAIKAIVAEESNIVFAGGRRKFMTRGRRRHNKSVKRNIMKSKSKGMTKSKGRARARAASMLKSAKQRFYKAGGGRGMGLGMGPSAPQPLQCNSPLVSQASPV